MCDTTLKEKLCILVSPSSLCSLKLWSANNRLLNPHKSEQSTEKFITINCFVFSSFYLYGLSYKGKFVSLFLVSLLNLQFVFPVACQINESGLSQKLWNFNYFLQRTMSLAKLGKPTYKKYLQQVKKMVKCEEKQAFLKKVKLN